MEKRTILENSNTRSNNLTLIKFIAAIMVIWGHAIILLQQSKDPISLLSRNEFSLGSVAVAIFFFASGFYVTKSLMKKRSAGEGAGPQRKVRPARGSGRIDRGHHRGYAAAH